MKQVFIMFGIGTLVVAPVLQIVDTFAISNYYYATALVFMICTLPIYKLYKHVSNLCKLQTKTKHNNINRDVIQARVEAHIKLVEDFDKL